MGGVLVVIYWRGGEKMSFLEIVFGNEDIF